MDKSLETAQGLLGKSLFSSPPSDSKEILDFLKDHAVALSDDQRQAITLLRHLGGYEDIISSILSLRAMSMPTKVYRTTIQELAKAQAAAKNSSMVSVLESKK
ncbi:hypothetical protein [Brevibacillus sp. SYSU BS000544]|uniref:hypothetical protein n=1 Tax=Brevibacillus sp. SYSU BS000544 TaxID=3416443 RepID=UPI003CE56238